MKEPDDEEKKQRHKWKEKVPYSKRIKSWWSKGTLKAAGAQGPLKVMCTIYQDGRPVTSAEGKRSRKESSHGAAKKRAISQLMLKVKKQEGRRLANLEGYEFRFKILEMG